jgi:glycine dehydrogenase subunit 2
MNCDADRFTGAPYMAPAKRLDETKAARQPVLNYRPPSQLQAAE